MIEECKRAVDSRTPRTCRHRGPWPSHRPCAELSRDSGLIARDDSVHVPFAAEVRFRSAPAAAPHLRPKARPSDQPLDGLRPSLWLPGRKQQAVLTVPDDLGQAAHITGNNRRFHGHGLYRDISERLFPRGHQQQIQSAKDLRHVSALAKKMHRMGQAEVLRNVA